jgi:hypothetical protein
MGEMVYFEQGDVFFTSNWSILGTLVRLNSGKNLLHPALVGHCGIIENSEIAIESAAHGVQRIKISDLLKRKTNIYIAKLNQESRSRLKINIDAFKLFIALNIGKPYDVKQVVQFFITRNTGLFQAKEDFSALFCSEFVTGCLETVNIINNIDASIKSPQDVFEYKNIYDCIVRIK